VFISRIVRETWSLMPQPHMQAGMSVVLSRTSHGPILAFYLMLDDRVHAPYIGEAFLNPHEPGLQAEDACQLGQHMLEQLARQDHTHLIFVDEENRLLLSRRATFDTSTQVMLARTLYEVQTLPPQSMEPDRFRLAAQWHMQHFSLDQARAQYYILG
jgi:hypothetical protein